MKNFTYNLFLALSLVTVSTTICMEDLQSTRPSKKPSWKQQIKAFLLNETEKFPQFAEFPEEIQEYIILQLTLYTTAKTLKKAVQSVRALVLVNKKFNTFINDLNFTKELINYLSQRYETAPEIVATLLATKGAQEYLKHLLFNSDFSTQIENKYVNVNAPNENGDTLLMLSIQKLDFPQIDLLLANPRTNVYIQNNQGNTALHLAILQFNMTPKQLQNKLFEVITKILKSKKLQYIINLQNENGNTPLHLALELLNHTKSTRIKHKLKNIAISLIKRGANIRSVNSEGVSCHHLIMHLDDENIKTEIQGAYAFRTTGI